MLSTLHPNKLGEKIQKTALLSLRLILAALSSTLGPRPSVCSLFPTQLMTLPYRRLVLDVKNTHNALSPTTQST